MDLSVFEERVPHSDPLIFISGVDYLTDLYVRLRNIQIPENYHEIRRVIFSQTRTVISAVFDDLYLCNRYPLYEMLRDGCINDQVKIKLYQYITSIKEILSTVTILGSFFHNILPHYNPRGQSYHRIIFILIDLVNFMDILEDRIEKLTSLFHSINTQVDIPSIGLTGLLIALLCTIDSM